MCLIFAGGICPVMAADAVTEDIDMVEICRHPADGGVTVIAGVTTCDVCLVLPGRIDAVVAAYAIANDSAVIKHGR